MLSYFCARVDLSFKSFVIVDLSAEFCVKS